jgi:hypothetical protein
MFRWAEHGKVVLKSFIIELLGNPVSNTVVTEFA